MTRALKLVLLAVIVAGILVTMRGAAQQDASNATRTVIGAREVWCTNDGRFARTQHTGWIPTGRCLYPVAVPPVRPTSRNKVDGP